MKRDWMQIPYDVLMVGTFAVWKLADVVDYSWWIVCTPFILSAGWAVGVLALRGLWNHS